MREFARAGRIKFLAATAVLAIAATSVVAGAAALPAQAHGAWNPWRPGFTSSVFASGAQLSHSTPAGSEQISQPDDITYLHHRLYVAFQNGVGPQGQASPTGNLDSTVVEFNPNGRPVAQWDLVGKCDGLTADRHLDRVIATVNEDANSSVYLIDPHGTAAHYTYNVPLPSYGGTDAISIYHGRVLISASAPGTTGAGAPQPTYPAVYEAAFDSTSHIATVTPLFDDEDAATVANLGPQRGQQTNLALTDPDSSEVVPFFAPRFAGDFMLTSQGDQQQIFVSGAGTARQSLSVLNLSTAVDDTAWPSDPWGAIYTTDHANDTIYEITGPFFPGSVFVAATPCDSNGAPSTCPGPGYPGNFLGRLNPYTGQITPVDLRGPAVAPQGMVFVP